MTYIRNGKRAHMDALRIRQQIAAAEAEKVERELAALLEIENDLRRLQRRRDIATQALREAQERTTSARVQLALPPIIHGGREGLEAAAREAAQHEKRRIAAGHPKRRKVA